ncbi:phosphatase PAP2 family protein [Blastococcus sp. SYSU D00669]
MSEAAEREVRDRAYALAVAVALVTGIVAVVCALVLGLPLRDPDGFLGPTYVRLPLIAGLLLAADVLPRALRRTRSLRGLRSAAVEVWRERWPWRRLRPVLIGLAAFYGTYVAYRNLKHYLPLLRPNLVDDELRALDSAFLGDVPPAQYLHDVLGTGVAAHVLSWVYLAFLVFVPASLGLALVTRGRSREASWYVTALCLNWSLGTASYYLLPSMGPVYAQPGLFSMLPETGTSALQESLLVSRSIVVTDPEATDRVQSIAAFASLHVSIILTAALIAQFVLTSRAVRSLMWVFFGLTVLATVYFGWHYVVDDIAGVLIAAIAVGLAGWGTGQFRRAPVSEAEAEADAADARRRWADVLGRLRRRPGTSPT